MFLQGALNSITNKMPCAYYLNIYSNKNIITLNIIPSTTRHYSTVITSEIPHCTQDDERIF